MHQLTDEQTDHRSVAAMTLSKTLAWSALIMLLQVIIFYLVIFLFRQFGTGDVPSDQHSVEFEGGFSLEDLYLSNNLALLENGLFIGFCSIASMLICCPLIFWVVSRNRVPNARSYLGLRGVGLLAFVTWIALTLALGPVYAWLLSIVELPHSSEFMVNLDASREDTIRSSLIYFFGIGVAAPVFEEFLFRGFILRAAQSTRLGRIGAVVLTALLFAALHVQYDMAGLLFVFFLGVLLGSARVQTGSLYVPLAMHVTNNLWALLAISLV